MKQMKTIILRLESDWKFCLGDVKRWTRVDHRICYGTTKAGQEVGDMEIFLKENPWIAVGVPHDWSTGELCRPDAHPSNGFKPRGIAWYYKEFDLPEYEEDACAILEFEGVMGESVVYVNGVLAMRSESGYTAFHADVSDYLLPGQKNMIVVSVDNSRWEGWWYEGAGIYRPVQLIIKPSVHFSHRKIFVRPWLESGWWSVRVISDVENTWNEAGRAEVVSRILDASGACVAEMHAECAAEAYETAQCAQETTLDNPEQWSLDRPYLYTLENQLMVEGVCVEKQTIPFGLRHIEWTDHGMFLNGIKTPVRGICCHQDHVGVGIAVDKSLTRYRIAKLKAMGCNAYRCAHHCPSEYLLQVCDELGMLVMAENRHFRSSDEVMAPVSYTHLTLPTTSRV